MNVVNGLCAVEYGLGWGVVNVNGSRVMTHTGGTMAFVSEQLIDLDHHLAVAVLSNIADELSSEAHVRHITALCWSSLEA